MKRFTILALLVLFVFAAFGSASATPNIESIEIDSTVFNPCTQEDVHFSGTVHIMQTLSEDENGGSHLAINISYADVLGTGLNTGNLYKYVGGSTQTVYQDSDIAPLTSTVQLKVRWVTAGGQNDLGIRVFQHITRNASGELVAYSYTFEPYTCS